MTRNGETKRILYQTGRRKAMKLKFWGRRVMMGRSRGAVMA